MQKVLVEHIQNILLNDQELGYILDYRFKNINNLNGGCLRNIITKSDVFGDMLNAWTKIFDNLTEAEIALCARNYLIAFVAWDKLQQKFINDKHLFTYNGASTFLIDQAALAVFEPHIRVVFKNENTGTLIAVLVRFHWQEQIINFKDLLITLTDLHRGKSLAHIKFSDLSYAKFQQVLD